MQGSDERYMRLAIKEALKAYNIKEVPVGAVIVDRDGNVVSKGHNKRETEKSAIAHAEIVAIERACNRTGDWRLEGHTLYVTLEPCMMCAGAIVLSRIYRVVFGAVDEKGGVVVSNLKIFDNLWLNHRPLYRGGVLSHECSEILKDFFKRLRSDMER